jgi:hypothetical protein
MRALRRLQREQEPKSAFVCLYVGARRSVVDEILKVDRISKVDRNFCVEQHERCHRRFTNLGLLGNSAAT